MSVKYLLLEKFSKKNDAYSKISSLVLLSGSSRDMGPDGCVLIKGCDENTHRNFETKLFESPNGIPDNANDAPIRLVLSSYYFGNGGNAQGLPDGLSDCSRCETNCDGCQGMAKASAYDASSTG